MYRIKSDYHLVLASGSPRRKELLSGLGLEFEVVVSGCNEDLVCGEPAKEMVERLACEKANFVANARPRSWVLGADTTVAIGEQILGKPRDTREAFQMLQQLQGREHLVWGAFCIVHAASNRQELRSDVTKVRMRPISPDEIERYIASGEPIDKAGSYAVQGIGAAFIEKIEGSYSNVVGLNVSSLVETLQKVALI